MKPDSAFPLMRFNTAISKRKASAVIVESVRVINSVRTDGNYLQPIIIDTPRIFIRQNPNPGRANDFEIAPFAKCGVGIVCCVTVAAVEPYAINGCVAAAECVTFGANSSIHGNTADNWNFLAN